MVCHATRHSRWRLLTFLCVSVAWHPTRRLPRRLWKARFRKIIKTRGNWTCFTGFLHSPSGQCHASCRILLRLLCSDYFPFFFCRFSTASRHEARKMIVKVSGIDLEQGNIQMIVIPVHFSLLSFCHSSRALLSSFESAFTIWHARIFKCPLDGKFFSRHSIEQCSFISSAIFLRSPMNLQGYNVCCTLSNHRLLSEKTSTIILSKSSFSSPSYLSVALH